MRTIAALVVTLTLLFPGQQAKAQTLEELKQNCERLESYWQRDPPSANSRDLAIRRKIRVLLRPF
jgi:hypothetical protein